MQRSLCDVEHLRAVHAAVVIHLLDEETIGEGRDVQHVEQRGLTSTNLVTSLDETDVTLEKQGSSQSKAGIPDGLGSKLCFKQEFTKISMVPLEILVVIPRAWKKEVFSGPRPVFWAGTVTSQGAMAPARAAAGT